MRFKLAACLALLLSVASPPAPAQEEAPDLCKAFIGDKWEPLGSGPMASCLKGVEQDVAEYNAQGFKFGLWGKVLISADRYYFYRSEDGGKNWQAIGLKSELIQTTDAAPTLPGARPEEVLSAVQRDSKTAALTDPEPGSPAPKVDDGIERRSCSLRVGSKWQLVANLSLPECAARLDESPDSYDTNGFKYAYWSGVFLAADATEVLKSSDSGAWEVLLERQPR